MINISKPAAQHRIGRLALAAAMVIALLLAYAGLVGCGGAKPPADCSWATSAAPKAAHSELAVLNDRSASEPLPPPDMTPPVVDAKLKTAVENKALISLGSFDGTAASVTWPTSRLSTDPGLDNPGRRAAAQAELRECLTRDTAKAARTAATVPNSDLLGALGAGAEHLGAGHARHRELVVITSGLVNSGCADLRRAAVGGPNEIDRIVADCRRAGELPDLRGVGKVTLAGIGHPAPGQSLPASSQLRWLGDLWTELGKAAGAQHVTVSTEAPYAAPGRRSDSAADPAVTWPRPQVTGSQVVIPADFAFEEDSAVLSGPAIPELSKIAARLAHEPGTRATIAGHTDQAPTTASYSRALSERRAEAVRTELINAGAPPQAVTARGYGDTRPAANELRPDGSRDMRAAAKNRRVVVMIHTHPS